MARPALHGSQRGRAADVRLQLERGLVSHVLLPKVQRCEVHAHERERDLEVVQKPVRGSVAGLSRHTTGREGASGRSASARKPAAW